MNREQGKVAAMEAALSQFVSLFSKANHGWDYPGLCRLRDEVAKIDLGTANFDIVASTMRQCADVAFKYGQQPTADNSGYRLADIFHGMADELARAALPTPFAGSGSEKDE